MDVIEFTGVSHCMSESDKSPDRTSDTFSFPREKRGQCKCDLNGGVTSQRYTYGH